ncbi:hypothetical protein EK21DRAFT_112554 [Setomelanomma holmii]|uniref:Uncharacterized protein n=1 Tax=Setomelanomma holmii TaxID=210430 RepID=A0A9P4LNF9_9PLEO|nr:hypothetical protein EK21DRAFT_112554 [Setomelanomma holmii]
MPYSDFDVGHLQGVPRNTIQSQCNFADLSRWGYTIDEHEFDEYCDFSPHRPNQKGQPKHEGNYWGIAPYLTSLGFSDKCIEEGGKWIASAVYHSDPYLEDKDGKHVPEKDQTYRDPNGKVRKVTDAYFHMAVSPEGGIMAQNRLGPRDAVLDLHPEGFSKAELVALWQSSDMMWAIPKGFGFAQFLIQHKNLVGLKKIDSVNLFQCENPFQTACMLFWVQNLAQPLPVLPQDFAPKDPGMQPPTHDDPNAKPVENSHNVPRSGVEPPTEALKARTLEKRNVVREHIFRVNEIGDVTLSLAYT